MVHVSPAAIAIAAVPATRTAAAVGDDGDADDRGTVEQQHPDGEPG